MTPAEVAALFKLGAGDLNYDRARDFICLRCGNREAFRVGVVGMVTLVRTGDIGDYEHFELDPEDGCRCLKCGADETVQKFIVEGLDDYLQALT